ncbi:methyltransferase [Xaviernesmea oryzae]|uniref:Methyltransferase n=1 Tax=Xaviernesmea oryzae TaxID=464029 RepID=A0A1Q9AZX3_9HYPH|nr:class I SAM-dependent methyltransferase [Xaviernesmea oryzae]OLP61282.1 methyltransferase [Xaviernesmea oryzae]SEL53426.1 S-adenosylmethionine-diacylgycerolhomoserine-N-methlytransferase [Xaviernesmea oryzae]
MSLHMPDHAERMDKMYRYQRYIYDATRKYYLFGRDTMIAELALRQDETLLEVGCGTGRNLALIARRYPRARLFGFDISREMLATAERNLSGLPGAAPVLRQADAGAFSAEAFGVSGFDHVVISYALSMIPPWKAAIEHALDALAPGGTLHIVDFGQQEKLPRLAGNLLKAWLERFHVTPRAELFTVLEQACNARGMTLATRRLGGGYAWLATCRAAA